MEIEQQENKLKDKIGEYIYDKKNPDKLLSIEGNVYRGRKDNEKGIRVVIKKIETKKFNDFQKCVNREVEANTESDSFTNVLERIARITDSNIEYFVYKDFKCTLKNYVEGLKDPNISMKHVLLTATEGLTLFHGKGLIHRNLNFENVVIAEQNGKFVGLISDLLYTKQLAEGVTSVSISHYDWNNSCSAPELMDKKAKIKNKVDIFSMGCIFFYGLTGSDLFVMDGTASIQNILNQEYEPNFLTLKENNNIKAWEVPFARDLIKSMVSHKPEERPSVDEIINHPFFWTPEKWDKFMITEVEKLKKDVNSKTKLDAMNKTYRKYKSWKKEIDPEVKCVLDVEASYHNGKYFDGMSHLMRAIRNLQAHPNKKLTAFLKENNFNDPMDYFLNKFPTFFYDFYTFVNKNR